MNPKVVVTALSTLALAFASCGEDEKETSGGGGEKAGGGAAKEAVTVSEKDIQFKPKTVTVAKGGTVTWVNDDTAPHDVTKESGPGPKFASGKGDMKNGDKYKTTFNTAGTVKYVCTVHPGMAGEVVVK